MNNAELEAKRKRYIVAGLRKLSYRWGERYHVLKQSQVEKDGYECAACSDIYSKRDVQIDHIAPVVDPNVGFDTWDQYITRMFCGREGFQVLCKPCHKEKTSQERGISLERRRKAKSNKTSSKMAIQKKARSSYKKRNKNGHRTLQKRRLAP